VGGRGGGKLRRELCHAARSRETAQGGVIVRNLLEEAPAEAVQQDQHDGTEGARPARKESVRQRGNARRAEQRPDAGRQGGEAILIVGWTNERGVECEHGLFSGADDSAETTHRQTAVPPTSSPSPNALYSTLNHPSDKKCDPQSHDGAGYFHAKALRRKELGTLRALRLGVSLLTVTRYR